MLHKDLALRGKHRGPGDVDAELQVLETLSPWRGMRLEPDGTAGWVSRLHRAGSRERRKMCLDFLAAAEGARGSLGLLGCRRAWGLVGKCRCLGQAPCREGEEHNLPLFSSHC